MEKMAEHRDGKTTLGNSHVREGVVVRPVVETQWEYTDELGQFISMRKITKCISDDYLLRRNATDGH
jgi:hypothetical protein